MINPAYPTLQAGISVVSGGGAWTFGSRVELVNYSRNEIGITGLQFQTTNIPSADVTQEILFEISQGFPGSETIIIQIPYNLRSDTAVGFYQIKTLNVFLPEPYSLSIGRRLSMRVADSLGSITYTACKLMYQSPVPIPGGNNLNNYQGATTQPGGSGAFTGSV